MSNEIVEAVELTLREYHEDVEGKLSAQHEHLRRGMAHMNEQVKEVRSTAVAALRNSGRAATPRPKAPSREIVIKSLVVGLAGIKQPFVNPESLAKSLYGDDRSFDRVVEAGKDPVGFMRKAVTNPAMTTVGGWASELVNGAGVYPGLIASLAPASAYAKLSRRGLRVELGKDAAVKIPARVPPASVPSPFVGEGQPIPVRAMALSTVTLAPKKAAVISHFTGELFAHSTPAIESIVSQAIEDDVALGVDIAMLGKGAGDAVTPAGLLYGVAPIVASTATGAEAIVEDLTALVAAIDPPPLDPVFVMGALQAVGAGLSLANGIPGGVVISDAVAPGTVICLDASDLATSVDDAPELATVEDAAVVNSDPALPVSTGSSGISADTAAPVTSFWQHNLYAVRLIEFVDWKMRRSGRVSFVEGVTW